jgi:phosphohistidine phosphatase
MQAIRVYLVRHGDAERASEGGDAARRLTAEGRRRFHALAAGLGERLSLARVLSSPFARAQETAEILATVTGVPAEVEGELTPGRSSGRDLLALALREGAGVALVGHNPEMAEAIAIADRRGVGVGVGVAPGTIAAIDLTPGGAALVWIEAHAAG